MSRGLHAFKQTDVTRAIKAAEAAGKEVARVEIDRDGKIVIVVGKQEMPKVETDVDRWLQEHNAHQS